MNTPIKWPRMLKIFAILIGFICIGGGMIAFNTTVEPERYLVSAIVLFGSGLCWLVSSIKPQFMFGKWQLIIILVFIFVGLLLGLIVVFNFCGGEYFCHSYRGYPGRWLRISQDMETLNIAWNVDWLSLFANTLFWSGLGFILLFINKIANRDNFRNLKERIKQI